MLVIGIAEPSPEIQTLIGVAAADLGHEVFPVERVEDADRCQLLVAEPGNPLGLEAAQRLRALRPQTPIVFVSIYPPAPETAALEPVAHLVKPFTLGELTATLRAAAERTGD